ncbi:MAG: hypothetical protein BYD32DRAFT_248240 [Podila humilis]|nr:MAG: hypothetical protein BYD32DRAFT_248240 [Podila humilis]
MANLITHVFLNRSPPRNQKYSVLVLGKTQAGKTALVEHIMSYATPSHTVDQSLLGDGTFSKTERTRTAHTKSSLPSYEVYDKASGSTIDFNPDEGDEEDIRDLLFTREDNIGLRPAPGAVSDAVEFELLNTPGLNQDQDVVQAADIVDGIISTRSFNLILIVVNIHDPLTAEQLLALRYYSKILRGLRSNIAFLYTHADYDLYLHPSENRQLALANKTRSLSRIFQGPTSGDFEPYPSFTIALTEKNLPVVQCLMQNTLRDILQLAVSNPPVIMDTSSMNLERINRIGHPSDFDGLQREMSLAYIYRELHLQMKVVCGPSVPSACLKTITFTGAFPCTSSTMESVKLDSTPGSIIDNTLTVQGSAATADRTPTAESRSSVLVLGRTQSGKSSLMQHMKKYADPTYSIDQSVLGDGNTSRTESTKRFCISSNLPAYEIVDNATGMTVDVQNLHAIQDEFDFHELLSGRENKYTLRMVTPDPSMPSSDCVEFQFLDTPGLNDTDHRSVAIAANIVKEILRTQSFNLILVTVSALSPLTVEYRLELEYYAKVLQGLHANIAFLYTHVDYANCHHSNINHCEMLSRRHGAFSDIFRGTKPISAGGVEFKHFTIDLLSSSKRPVVQCLIRNTLREILQLAVANSPVVVDGHWSNIARIQAIDHPDKKNLVCRKWFRARQAALAA